MRTHRSVVSLSKEKRFLNVPVSVGKATGSSMSHVFLSYCAYPDSSFLLKKIVLKIKTSEKRADMIKEE
jgi:hypothetical protein